MADADRAVQPGVIPSISIVDVANGVSIVPPTFICAYGALSIPAYYRAISFLADNLSSMPRSVCQDGAKLATDQRHPLDTILKRRPNGYQSPYILWRTFFAHAAHCGNAYIRIERDPLNGQPIGLHNLLPGDVLPFRYTRDGETEPSQFYAVRSTKAVLAGADVLHLQAISYDGLLGLDPVSLFEGTLQRAATLDRYQLRFLQKGTVLRGAIEIPAAMTDEQITMLRGQLNTYFQGANSDYDVIILPDGAKLSNQSLSPEQSQIIEQGAYTTKQIAQITGVPPEFLYEMGEAKYVNNVEQAGQNVVRYTLRPWIEQAEAELTLKLLSPADQDAGYHVLINPDALLRGSTADVNTSAVTTKNAGLRTPNEARALLNLPPLADPEADKLHTLGSTTPAASPSPAKPV